ncbi:long-chain-fatty-acid--CoA ligase [Rhizorhabdus dicambivorans]|nr:long-chain-fatty-acid--CoA ligase [Rhizorhabdus dicambivorans]
MLLHEAFDYHAGSRGGQVLSRMGGVELSYGAGRARSIAMASALLGLGVKPGDRVVTILGNSIDALLLIHAASRTGIVCVPLNWRLAPREWVGMIEDAGARVVIADPAHGEALEAAGGRPEVAICSRGALPGWLSLDELVERAAPGLPPVPVTDEAAVLQLYTSGTTGKPKGAMISHRGVVANIGQIELATGSSAPGQRSLHVLPMFHIAGAVFALRAMAHGETLVILAAADPAVLLRTIVEERIAHMFIVPTLIQMMLRQPEIAGMRFPHLRQIMYGASPIAEHVLVEAMGVFGCAFLQGFGMTELSCAGTFLSEADHVRALSDRPELLASAGRALPGTELRIVDAGGRACAPGEIGEILIRGPQVFPGYWKLPEATATALRDGWLHSGDAGSLDEEGYLFIRDRLKDMIVSGGENVYPAEVEAVLHQHPQIAEASVIGVPDEKWGETVMAVIVAEAGARPSEAEIDRHCRESLGGFKLPRRYSFVDALPRNASGKILKRELRASFWNHSSRQIG